MSGKRDIVIETNLRDDFLITRSAYFRDRGYTANLIFMLLPDVETSIERVNSRVDKKGHFVDVESIKYNFEHSLKTLMRHFSSFDTLHLFDASLNSEVSVPKVLLILKDNCINYLDSNAPLWSRPTINEIIQRQRQTK